MSDGHPDINDLLDELDEPRGESRSAPTEPDRATDPEEPSGEGEDLVALAGAAASRFAAEAAAAAAVEAAGSRRLAAASGVRDVPRRRLRSEEDDGRDGLLQYPSAAFPAPPVFRVRVPPGWVAVPLPDAEMAVRRPEPVDGFLANVLVRVRRIAATPAVHDDIRAVVAVDQPPPDMEVLADEVVADVTTPVRRMAVRFPAADGRVLRARYLLVYVPATEHLANIVTAVATWPDSAPTAVAAEMEAVVRSLRLFTPRPS